MQLVAVQPLKNLLLFDSDHAQTHEEQIIHIALGDKVVQYQVHMCQFDTPL